MWHVYSKLVLVLRTKFCKKKTHKYSELSIANSWALDKFSQYNANNHCRPGKKQRSTRELLSAEFLECAKSDDISNELDNAADDVVDENASCEKLDY